MVSESLTAQEEAADTSTIDLDELDTEVSRAVVAELGLSSIEELDETIYEAINPDALNDLFREDNWAQVTFNYNGCRVTVDSDGQISVTQ